MRIASSTVSDNVVRQIQQLGAQQAKLQTRVSTGQRITNPSDDAAAVGRVINLESERRALTQFARNADRALEISQASFSGLQQLKALSDRATEIGTLAAGATSDDARDAYAAELDQLLEQAAQLGNTRFRNDYLFAGTAVDAPPFTLARDADGRITGATYAGNADQASIPLSESAAVTPGTTGATNQSIGDFVNQLAALRDALRAGDGAAITATREQLIATEDVFVDALAEQGAVQMRIEVNQDLQKDRADNLEQLVSADTDDDLATTIVRLNQSQVAYQAALQSSANIMRLSLLDYLK